MTETWAPGNRPSDINDRARAEMGKPSRYTALIQARCTPAHLAQVNRAAKARGMIHAQYVRLAVGKLMQLDGFDDPEAAEAEQPRDAGSLYNVIGGQRCYALVSGGRVLVVTSRLDAVPDLFDANHYPAGYAPSGGDRWVPITFEDSQPFDIERHYREAPAYRIDADKVVRVYQVVDQGSN